MTKQLSCTFTYQNSYTKTISFKSLDENVATVSSTGLITAKSVGTARIQVSSASSKDTKTCTVTVTAPVTSITLNKTSLSLHVGEEETLSATVKPDNATDKSVTWVSSNTSVASVNNIGKVTAITPGSATVTCQANDGSEKKATCSVTVTSVPATSVTLNKTSLSLQVGEKETLTATVKPDNAADKSVTWTSNNSSVATVSTSGVVNAISAGTATITAKTSNGKSASCTVTVKNNYAEPINITLIETMSLEVGETWTIEPVITPAGASTTLTWWSDNEDVAIVSASGKVVAIGEGTTKIWVKTSNGKSASCNIMVTRLHNGDTFTAITDEGIEMTFKVISEEEKTCQVGDGDCAIDYSTFKLTIPSSVNNYRVISIGDNAFYDCKGLSYIIIPNSVTSIGAYSFKGCIGMITINIPNSVTSALVFANRFISEIYFLNGRKVMT